MKRSVPLIRLSTINPFLAELRRRGVDARALLGSLDLPTDIPVSDEVFVAASTLYQFVERSADAADDRRLGFAIGAALDPGAWAPLAPATESPRALVEVLSRFAVNATRHSSATIYDLHIDGGRSQFGFRRTQPPPFMPAQNDAFYVGLLSRLLRDATGAGWDAGQVLFHVSDPECVPNSRDSFRVARGDGSEFHMSFPSAWLFCVVVRREGRRALQGVDEREPPRSLIESLRVALRPHLADPDLSVARAAGLCGFDARRLSRELRDQGTTLAREIANLRANEARKLLLESNLRISEVAERVGYHDPTVFSRAFKNWTKQSPQAFRRNAGRSETR